jgi:sRNA-binding carbon storage regulator CsrA
MLVLSRKKGGRIIVRPITNCPHCGKRLSEGSQEIIVTAVDIRGQSVRIGLEAPLSTNIVREEVDGRE